MVTAHVDPPVAEANRKVSEEMVRFRAALPKLLEDPALKGRWVVFKDGAVVRASDDDREAYRWAVDTLGRLSGIVLAPVEPERVYRLGSAASMFRFEPDER
jgi:hypothetical protein